MKDNIMDKHLLSDEEINIVFLGKDIMQEIKINSQKKKKIIKRKISLGFFTLFLILGKII